MKLHQNWVTTLYVKQEETRMNGSVNTKLFGTYIVQRIKGGNGLYPKVKRVTRKARLSMKHEASLISHWKQDVSKLNIIP